MLRERIQPMIDRNVAGSPRARELLASLDGRSLVVAVRFTPWRATVTATGGRLLLSRDGAAADVTVSGTLLNLLSLARGNAQEVIRRGDVRIEGDGAAAESFQELLGLLRPDLEAGLASVIGEVPAYGAGALLRKALDYGRQVAQTGALNVGEYLAHERRELVPRAEAQQFIEEVDTLRETVDRIAARVARLEGART
ncbi:MAG TPA: SCP2 sterol-binding domain-containing protein [Steroidobacteraceae bacterium]|nr:SCP2 sterol-binding domain-containing protein [Steroidobacteraceae bacterium]